VIDPIIHGASAMMCRLPLSFIPFIHASTPTASGLILRSSTDLVQRVTKSQAPIEARALESKRSKLRPGSALSLCALGGISLRALGLALSQMDRISTRFYSVCTRMYSAYVPSYRRSSNLPGRLRREQARSCCCSHLLWVWTVLSLRPRRLARQ
jgi:hypothetical protein